MKILGSCFLFLISASLSAQTIDTAILGSVTDTTGAVVPKAAITVTQTATGVRRTAESNADGNYEVRYLVPGEYSVEVRGSGFRTARTASVQVQINQQVRIDFAMQVGEATESMEVNAATPLLQTENATLGEVIGQEKIVNLPLNGRTFTQLATLTPGVRVTDADLFTAPTDGSRIIANGARDAWLQVNLDGITT